jgi:hypothetical protein
MSAARSSFFSRQKQVGIGNPIFPAKAPPKIKWPTFDDTEDHQEMNPDNPNHQGKFPASTCNGRVTRHKIKKEGNNKGKFFFTCDCQGEDEHGKKKNGIMMEIEFKKNPHNMIRCKTIEALVKKEQVKDALNQQLGRSGLKKEHCYPEFWDAIGDYADALSEQDQGGFMSMLEDNYNAWVRGEHPNQQPPEAQQSQEEGEITDD